MERCENVQQVVAFPSGSCIHLRQADAGRREALIERNGAYRKWLIMYFTPIKDF